MCYFVFFGSLSAVLTGVAYVLIYRYTAWHPYLIWLAAINGVTFVMYVIDRWMGRRDKVDTPETIMHLLFALGGFVGAWLARALLGYRVDLKDRSWLYILLLVSVVGHAVLVYHWLIGGPPFSSP